MSLPSQNLDIFGRGSRGTRHCLIACEVMHRECCWAAAVSRNIIDLRFVTQGLHDLVNTSMAERLQAEIDAVAAGRYDAIVLGYALCNNGIVGLRAREAPLVVPRAHDCITLFMGSKEAYDVYFHANAGTYFMTTGWAERDKDNLETTISHEDNMLRRMGLDKTFDEYVAQYGEEYARMIMGTIGGMEHYRKLAQIDMGLAPAAEARVRERSEAAAAERGWEFEMQSGRLDLFRALVDGPAWDDAHFLLVQPGQRIEASFGPGIIQAV